MTVSGGDSSSSGWRAPAPGNSSIVPGRATSACTRGWSSKSVPRCSSELGSERCAIRAVPMATSRSRGCCKRQMRVRLCSGVRNSHQQAACARRQRVQSKRGSGSVRGMGKGGSGGTF